MQGPWIHQSHKYKGFQGRAYSASPYSPSVSTPVPLQGLVKIEKEGEYAIWVRGLSHGDRALTAEVAGTRLKTTNTDNGAARGEYTWERAGVVKLAVGMVEVKIHPVGKSFPTVDALVLTPDADYKP